MSKKTSSGVRKQAHAAAKRGDARGRIRELTVRALRDRDLTRPEISGLVHEVLEGASAAVDQSIPASRRSALRQVFEGLGDAVDSVASAGARTAKTARQRTSAIARAAKPAARKARVAKADFLLAVGSFARRASSEIGEELDLLVKRARRTGGAVAESARKTADAADGRLAELSGEAARAGVSVARRAASGIAMAAGGLLEGLGDVVSPAKRAPARRKARAKLKSKPKPKSKRNSRPKAKPAARKPARKKTRK